jgi:hypothetical protein
MSEHVYCGIDPGAHGAAAAVGDDFHRSIRFSKLTEEEIYKALWTINADCRSMNRNITFILEKVSIRPTDGRGSGAKFMAQFGMLRGFLIALEVRRIEIAPVVWSRKMGRIDPKGTSITDKKRLNQQLAESLYPGHGIIRETCDAYLLAEYGRRFCQ